MPYVTFEEAAAKVGGVKRLVKDVMVGHGTETAESHPYFDEVSEQVDREVDIALERGGYATPLDALSDPKLRGAALSWLYHLLSETSSTRESWIEDGMKSAERYFAQVATREISVLGAEPEEVAANDYAGILGSFDERPMFDLGDRYSGINDIAPPLPGGFNRRW